MKGISLNRTIWISLMVVMAGWGCKQQADSRNVNISQDAVSFELLTADQTGLHFANTLKPNASFNMFTYMYFYNGAGVGAADFNQDGLPDLFYAGNQQRNRLFLNEGDLKFKDVSDAAAIPADTAWSTGVSIVDINNDGLPDIYVCRVANFADLKGSNQLLVCQGIKDGIPWYRDEAEAYGLNFSGFSTQAAFLDYDLDGDLDMYLLNHATNHNGRFAERSQFLNTYDTLSGDRLYRNDGKRFTDVTRETGIQSSAIGYGLGISVADINLDGWPDIYIGNDFHENDYCYINNRNGGFVDEATMRTMHTSQFSMGVDVADITNDGHPEILSMDMLPADKYMLKRSLGEDTYDIFNMKLRYGYHPYFTRNNLQLNRRNNKFSETGLYSGIAATDWSWACLWMDFDNDGWKDLFVSNGIPKRLNDIDYVTFITDDRMQQKIINQSLTDSDFAFINRFPEIKLPNYFFSNKGEAKFDNKIEAVTNSRKTYSNGAVYADFDNDGDLDIAVNNIDDEAMLYENKLADSLRSQSVTINLKGPASNTVAVGSRLVLFSGQQIRTYDHQPVHGFMSAMAGPMHVGLGNTSVDSAMLIWPDNSFERINLKASSKPMMLKWKAGLPKFPFDIITNFYKTGTYAIEDITQSTGLKYTHTENTFQEFNREQLIPQMMSTEGPALAVADVNGDGLDDVFIGAARDFKPALFIQLPGGKFTQTTQPALDADSTWEDVDAVWADVNNDQFPDLIVASGGNEFYGGSPYTMPRVYMNDGKGNYTRKPDAFSNVHLTASCVAAADFNKDGFTDLFIGARCLPFAYGVTPQSYLLQNDGTGKFTDVTNAVAPELANAGLVKNALWFDVDADRNVDLLLSCQWAAPCAFISKNGKLERKDLIDKKGWWNFLLPFDADGDGKTDLLAGNMGLNNRFKASKEEPLNLYINDFDGNGAREQVFTYYLNNQQIPFASKDELQKQLPIIKKKYLYAEDFAKASLSDIFGEKQLGASQKLTASYLANALLVNKGGLKYEMNELPWLAQLSTYRDAVVVNVNGDSLPDILLVGNFLNNNIQMGRNDADFGSLLVNKGNGNFEVESLNGVALPGESRKIKPITIGNKKAYIIARNNTSAVILAFTGQ